MKFPLGLWGIHNSLLPKYRGGAPLVWSIMNGDASVGSTLFQIDEGIDSGPVLLQVSTNNTSDRNVGEILSEIRNMLLQEIPAAWLSIVDGSAATTPQPHDHATYCSQRTPEDGLINWQNSALTLHNFIRAQTHPYSGAFTMVNGKKVVIHRTQVLSHTHYGIPGQVMRRNSETVIINCGQYSAIEVISCSVNGEEVPPIVAFPNMSLRLGQQNSS
jgi:methionyl-tRNA formyltransferase